jgi:lysine-N-methylase
MPAVSLPILALSVREQRYSCHGCGNCCRDFTVQLREEDLRKLIEQNWESRLGNPVTVDFRGTKYLRQRDDGACIFLMDDGLCRIHKEFGFQAKPVACQLFPFQITPGNGGLAMGVNFACQSVLENKGAELKSHLGELGRMAGELHELNQSVGPPLLTDRLRTQPSEVGSLISHIDRWFGRTDVDLPLRLDGLAWIAQSLANAKLESVRGERFAELLDVLFGVLPDELAHHPIDPPSSRQLRMLRQAVFMRTEDPRLPTINRIGRLRTTLSQLSRSRRFKRGRGVVPVIGVGWPTNVRFETVAHSPSIDSADEARMIDGLLTRWLRASVLGHRCWGAGYYGWPMIAGLQNLLLSAACVGWLAKLHAADRLSAADSPSSSVNIVDVRAALGRIDRTLGRAKWLGSAAERLRLTYLNLDDGLRRVVADAFPTG